MKKELTNLNVSMILLLRLLKRFIWFVLVYECEAWTKDLKMRRRLDAVVMWFLRRLL